MNRRVYYSFGDEDDRDAFVFDIDDMQYELIVGNLAREGVDLDNALEKALAMLSANVRMNDEDIGDDVLAAQAVATATIWFLFNEVAAVVGRRLGRQGRLAVEQGRQLYGHRGHRGVEGQAHDLLLAGVGAFDRVDLAAVDAAGNGDARIGIGAVERRVSGVLGTQGEGDVLRSELGRRVRAVGGVEAERLHCHTVGLPGRHSGSDVDARIGRRERQRVAGDGIQAARPVAPQDVVAVAPLDDVVARKPLDQVVAVPSNEGIVAAGARNCRHDCLAL